MFDGLSSTLADKIPPQLIKTNLVIRVLLIRWFKQVHCIICVISLLTIVNIKTIIIIA